MSYVDETSEEGIEIGSTTGGASITGVTFSGTGSVSTTTGSAIGSTTSGSIRTGAIGSLSLSGSGIFSGICSVGHCSFSGRTFAGGETGGIIGESSGIKISKIS